MAERTTKTGIAISSVDENYTAPANATPEEATKARLAAAMREGVKREKARGDATISGIKAAHVDEMNRAGALIARASHRDGLWHGAVAGAFLVALIISGALYAGAWLQTNGWSMRVSDERIPRSAVPTLENEYTGDADYERVNPREPPSAH